MKIGPNRHLTYCLNIHPGETWDENLAAIREKAFAVKQRVCPDASFGLGLRIGSRAAVTLQDPARRAELKACLADQDCYAFTINGFPYGAFHAGAVKEKVYQPDWRTTARRDYTIRLCDILADILPDGVDGSISTVPGSFKPWIIRPDDDARMVERLAECAIHLARLRDQTGRLLHIGLEPEPGCYLETTDETLKFFIEQILSKGVPYVRRRTGCEVGQAETWLRTHLGVCLDTCHVAIQFETPADVLAEFEAEEIRVSKIQLSAALEAFNERTCIEALHPFVEPVYLHQVKALTRHGAIRSWNDLPDALRQVKDQREFEQLRVHFHVPLFWQGSAQLGTTATGLDQRFFEAVATSSCRHLEIETYTFDVLPESVFADDVVACIAREYEWVTQRLQP